LQQVARLVARVEDAAGNTAAIELFPDAGLAIDTIAPLAPDTSTPGAIVYRRIPWGAAESEGRPRFTLRGLPGATAGRGAILALTSSSGTELGRASTLDDGSFPPVELLTVDQQAPSVIAVDEAGNVSPSAPVHDFEWVATMGGKRVGSNFENPHAFFARGCETHALRQSGDVEYGASDGLALTGDDAGVFITSGSSWRNRRSDKGVTAFAMVWDSARARAIALAKNGSVDTTVSELYDDDWAQVPSGASSSEVPTSRDEVPVAYDFGRERLVLFGGYDAAGGGYLADLWEWSGTEWVRPPNFGTAPAGRARHATAYDAQRGVVVIFGGQNTSGVLDDFWSWDGRRWTPIAKANSQTPWPRPRRGAAMAYDPYGGRVFLYGGASETGLLGDLWSWNGSTWQEVSRTSPWPEPRVKASLAFDARNERLVVLGGTLVDDALEPLTQEVWEWDGQAWSPGAPAPFVPLAAHHVFDAKRGAILARFDFRFGSPITVADAGALPPTRTWALQGKAWHPVYGVGTLPGARGLTGATYDAPRSRIVMSGGALRELTVTGDRAKSASPETWQLDERGWKLLSVETLDGGQFDAGPRVGPSMVSLRSGELIRFGGFPEMAPAPSDVLEAYRDGGWMPLPQPQAVMDRPAPRSQSALVEGADGGAWLWGGYGSTDGGGPPSPLGDLWRLDEGLRWSKVSMPDAVKTWAPPAMAFDGRRRKAVLMSADSAAWEFDGAALQSIGQLPAPLLNLAGAGFVYHEAIDRFVLFGGYKMGQQVANGLNPFMYQLKPVKNEWGVDSPLDPEGDGNPSPRANALFVDDRGRRRIVLFGGANSTLTGPLQEHWEYQSSDWRVGGLFEASLTSIGLGPQTQVMELIARARAAGDGSIPGARLSTYFDGAWASPLAPTTAQSSTSSLASLELRESATARLLALLGPRRSVAVAVHTAGVSGVGPATLFIDSVEVELRYRQP
jgi:hypothetical protein